MIAEEFEPLIAAAAIARALERGNMGKRAIEQRGVLEAIADALLKRTIAAATAAARVLLCFDAAPVAIGAAATSMADGCCGETTDLVLLRPLIAPG